MPPGRTPAGESYEASSTPKIRPIATAHQSQHAKCRDHITTRSPNASPSRRRLCQDRYRRPPSGVHPCLSRHAATSGWVGERLLFRSVRLGCIIRHEWSASGYVSNRGAAHPVTEPSTSIDPRIARNCRLIPFPPHASRSAPTGAGHSRRPAGWRPYRRTRPSTSTHCRIWPGTGTPP